MTAELLGLHAEVGALLDAASEDGQWLAAAGPHRRPGVLAGTAPRCATGCRSRVLRDPRGVTQQRSTVVVLLRLMRIYPEPDLLLVATVGQKILASAPFSPAFR